MRKIFTFIVALSFSVALSGQSISSLHEKAEIDVRGTCPSNSLVSNPSTSGGWALTSSTNQGVVNYLKFQGTMLPQGAIIQGFRMWGLMSFHNGTAWSQCAADNMDFLVRFHNDQSGVPGTIIHEEVVTASAITTTEVTFGTWTMKIMEINLATPVALNNGFVALASTNAPSCWFMSVDSENGITNVYIYNTEGAFVQRMITPQTGSPYPASVGFCVLGIDATNVGSIDNNDEVLVYPNPATALLNIKSSFIIDQLKLFDTAGRVVFSTLVNENFYTIETNKLSGGIYFLQVTSGEKIKTQKVKIQ